MAFSHGSKAKFQLKNAAGSLTDISAYITSISMPHAIESADVSVMGNTAKQFVVGLEDGSISIDWKVDPVIEILLDGIKFGITAGGPSAFQYDPQGTATGLSRYSGNCFLTSYNIDTSVSDSAKGTATLQITGAITRVTQ